MAITYQEKIQKDWKRTAPQRKKWDDNEGDYTKTNPDTGKATWKPGAREQFEREQEEKYGRGTSTHLNTKQKRTYENGERARKSYAARIKASTSTTGNTNNNTGKKNTGKPSGKTNNTNNNSNNGGSTSTRDRIAAAMKQAAAKGREERVRFENSSYVKNLKKQAANKAREAAMSRRGG